MPIVKKEKVVDEDIKKPIDLIKEIDINSLTPIKAMKKMIELKEIFFYKSDAESISK